MKFVLTLGGVGLVLLMLQGVVSTAIPVGIRPDLILIFALALGLRAGSSSGLVLAFLAGFAIDALSGAPLGLFSLLRGTACAATRAFDRALYLRAAGPWAIYVFGYSIADALLLGVCLRSFAPETALGWSQILLQAPGAALATALVAAPLLGVFRLLDADAGREAGWTLVTPRGSRARP